MSRQAKHYAHRGIIALVSCDKAFQDPCHSANEGTKVCTATHQDMYTWVSDGTGVRASQDNRHSVPTHIPIPGPTLTVAGGGGDSNTTHALLSPDPETLPIGEVSRPATGEFLGTKKLQGQPTVAPYAPLTAGPNSSLSQRYGPAIIP